MPAARAVDVHGLFCGEAGGVQPRAGSASRSSLRLAASIDGVGITGRWTQELSAFNVFRAAIDGGRATIWNVERAYRTGRGRGCRVGGRGIYHDHALCRRPRIAAATA